MIARWLAIPLVAAAICGCAEPTQLVVHVWTDLRVTGDVDQVRVRASLVGDATPTYDNTHPLQPSDEMEFRDVLSFGAGPRDEDASRRVHIFVDAVKDGTTLFTTEVRTGFAYRKRLRLDVYLARRCLMLATPCAASETCGLDGCVSPEVPVERLPPAASSPPVPIDPRTPPGAPDAGTIDASTIDASTIDAGAVDAGAVALLRQRAPLSTSRVWTTSPTLRWARPAGASVSFELFRGATAIVASSVDADAVPLAPLPAGVYRWHIRPTAGPTGAWGPWWIFVVPRMVSGVDISSGTVPDVNADGLSDLVTMQTNSGVAQLVPQVAEGGSFSSGVPILALTEPLQLLRVVVNAGDINGDGYADILVGAPSVASGAGVVDVFLGGAAGLDRLPIRTLPSTPGAQFGASIAPIGDVDADGYADVVVGAPGVSRAFVYHGSPRGLEREVGLLPTCTVLDFGKAVAGADIDGNGLGDVLVGGPGGCAGRGAVFVFPSTGSGFAVPIVILDPRAGMDGVGFGAPLASAGDIDIDGRGDVLIGHPSAPPNGRAWLAPGAALMDSARWTQYSSPSTTGAGTQLAGAGDVSGDGRNDVAVGAPASFSDSGRVITYSGTSTIEVFQYIGGISQRTGSAIAHLGDATGDGYDDMVIGSPGGSVVTLLRGPYSVTDSPMTLIGGADYGVSIAGAQ